MTEINKNKAIKIYLKKLESSQADLKKEIALILNLLEDDQILKLFEDKNINYIKEVGINDKDFYDFINKIKEDKYYLTCILRYIDWEEEDYSYYDDFDLKPKLESFLEYISYLFEDKNFELAYKYSKELASLEINVRIFDKYGNDVESRSCSVQDLFYYLDDDMLFLAKYSKILLAIQILSNYNYDSLAEYLNKYRYISYKKFEEDLSFIEDRSITKKVLRKLLIDSIEKNSLRYEAIVKALNFVDEKDLFETYFYEGGCKELLLDSFYNYLESHNIDSTPYILNALPQIENQKHKDFYYNILINKYKDEDSYKIEAYKNLQSTHNFLNLFQINDLSLIPSLVKDNNFHNTLLTLNKEKIKNLRLDQMLFLLGLLKNKPVDLEDVSYSKNEIKLYRNAITVTKELVDFVTNTSLEKLDEEIKSGLKAKSGYSYLASYLYNADYLTGFKLYLRTDYSIKYYRFKNFIKEIDNRYSKN